MTASSPSSSQREAFRLFRAPERTAFWRSPGNSTNVQRTLAACLLAWVPLMGLSALQGELGSDRLPFRSDFAVHVRMGIVLPVLLLGHGAADRLFARAMSFLLESGAVAPESRARLRARLERFAELRDSWVALLGMVVAAYALTVVEYQLPINQGLSWKYRQDGLTAAGVWYFLLARPLVYTALLSWLWSFGLWTALLLSMVRLPLKLSAYHPDKVGGIEPVLAAHRVFLFLGFAVGADLAGALANRLVHYDEPLLMYKATALSVVLVVAFGLLAPLVLLARILVPARLDAMDQFGAMGFALSRAVRSGAMRTSERGLDDPFEQLISAHYDASNGHKVVTGTRVVPIGREDVILFLMAPLLPLLIASLAQVPLEDMIEQLRKLLEP